LLFQQQCNTTCTSRLRVVTVALSYMHRIPKAIVNKCVVNYGFGNSANMTSVARTEEDFYRASAYSSMLCR